MADRLFGIGSFWSAHRFALAALLAKATASRALVSSRPSSMVSTSARRPLSHPSGSRAHAFCGVTEPTEPPENSRASGAARPCGPLVSSAMVNHTVFLVVSNRPELTVAEQL